MHDLIIVGAGPAGLSASVYASRYKLRNIIIGKVVGGTVNLAHDVANYLGFPSIPGPELGKKMAEHARGLGAKLVIEDVSRIEKTQNGFKTMTAGEESFEAKTLILATGTERRKLDVLGEKEYLGKGVSYCTNCDAPFFRDKTVALIGGSNAAVSGALHAVGFAQKAYIIYRKDKLRAEPVWTEQALKNPKIEIIYNTNILEILGDGSKVTGIKLDKPYQGESELVLDGVFIEIGGVPGTSLAKKLAVELDKDGYVKVKPDLSTNVPGFFAAGDIANIAGEFHQIVTAVAEGGLAAYSAFKYLKGGAKENGNSY